MEILCTVRNSVGESPLWSTVEEALYWVDIEGRRIHRFDWASREVADWAMPERVGCIALHGDGGLVAAMESGLFLVRGGNAVRLYGMQFPHANMRFNDGRCDRNGRFWVTSMVCGTNPGGTAGALYRCSADGFSSSLVEGLLTGNGLAFSPDGTTMYLSDSHPRVRQVWAFDLDSDGMLSNRRDFVDMNRHPGRPDGAAVDVEGGYWICANDAGMVHRFAPDGRLDRSLAVPVSKPSMCAFGGPALDLLFITSIRPEAPAEGYDASLDGGVFVARPGISGLPEVPFAN